jgi:hypothetical protein
MIFITTSQKKANPKGSARRSLRDLRMVCPSQMVI